MAIVLVPLTVLSLQTLESKQLKPHKSKKGSGFVVFKTRPKPCGDAVPAAMGHSSSGLKVKHSTVGELKSSESYENEAVRLRKELETLKAQQTALVLSRDTR